jgi:glyoxylase-like metal-dependent hydrolase (beta-lactamase superfamily II)
VPVPVYLIQTNHDENVLVDTGLHPANVDNPYHTWGEDAAEIVLPILTPADRIEPRLAEIGLGPGDITHVVNTHLHPDHCGANFLFPHAVVRV